MAKIICSSLVALIFAGGIYALWPRGAHHVDARAGALSRLDKASDKPWTAVTDSGRLKTLKDGVLELSSTTLEEKSVEFLSQSSADLFGVPFDDLKFDRLIKGGRSKVIYRQEIGGVPVEGSTVTLVFDDNRLMRIESGLKPLIQPE